VNQYPIALRLDGRRCVVVGGGKVAARKVPDLLAAGALVTVISPALVPSLLAASEQKRVDWQTAPYAPGMLTALRPLLVFAATDSPAVNQEIAAEAHAIGALVDTVDDADAGDFRSMAAVRRGSITIAVSTGGASPALSAHLRRQLEATIGQEYAILAAWMAELRPVIQAHLPSESARKQLWETIIASPILETLRKGNEATARQILQQLVSESGSGTGS
jgi:precorrin-2 dehydrogenase / sirohydrochlorin ferrochelatase